MASSTQPEPLPPDSEQRLAAFCELVGTAISNAQARGELARMIEEQAALRRVATLVARAVAPEDVFGAVIEEVARMVGAHHTVMIRNEADGGPTLLAAWSVDGCSLPEESGVREWVWRSVLDTGWPARLEVEDAESSCGCPVGADNAGVRSLVGCPILVEGRVWGAIFAGSRKRKPFPEDTESRITGFTELVATAISNAVSRAQLAASRARIVATADDARRRIERDLHDGIQQRLVTLSLELRGLEEALPPDREELLVQLSDVQEGLVAALDEVREISRGIHPAILSEGGLVPALKSLGRRSAVPVELDLRAVGRLPAPVEAAAYYVASEALANAVKHANATVVQVEVEVHGDTLHLSIRDDGVGGADPTRGSGILGLTDRVEALGGTIAVISPLGDGTSIVLDLPIELVPHAYR
jgi:signal transduction histidine kinase